MKCIKIFIRTLKLGLGFTKGRSLTIKAATPPFKVIDKTKIGGDCKNSKVKGVEANFELR